MSPARSTKQQRLMAAALHGATFPKAQAVRETMTAKQLREFATGPLAKVSRAGTKAR